MSLRWSGNKTCHQCRGLVYLTLADGIAYADTMNEGFTGAEVAAGVERNPEDQMIIEVTCGRTIDGMVCGGEVKFDLRVGKMYPDKTIPGYGEGYYILESQTL